jgi:hypothetical protein
MGSSFAGKIAGGSSPVVIKVDLISTDYLRARGVFLSGASGLEKLPDLSIIDL